MSIISCKSAFNAIYTSELAITSGLLKIKPKEQGIEKNPKPVTSEPSKKPLYYISSEIKTREKL